MAHSEGAKKLKKVVTLVEVERTHNIKNNGEEGESKKVTRSTAETRKEATVNRKKNLKSQQKATGAPVKGGGLFFL